MSVYDIVKTGLPPLSPEVMAVDGGKPWSDNRSRVVRGRSRTGGKDHLVYDCPCPPEGDGARPVCGTTGNVTVIGESFEIPGPWCKVNYQPDDTRICRVCVQWFKYSDTRLI